MVTNSQNLFAVMEKTKNLMAQEDQIRTKMKWVSWGFPIVILLIFVIFIFLFAGTLKNFDNDRFFSKLERNLVHVYPDIGSELQRVGNELFPHYAAEFHKSMFEATPQMESVFGREMTTLQSNLEKDIVESLDDTLSAISEKQRSLLFESVPVLKDNEEATKKVIKALNNATINWVKEIFVQTLEDHTVAFIELSCLGRRIRDHTS